VRARRESGRAPPESCAGGRDDSTHEFSRAVSEIESAQAQTRAQKLHDGAEEGYVVALSVPDEAKRKAARWGRNTKLVLLASLVVCAEDGDGGCGLVERSMEGKRDEVVRVEDAHEYDG